MSSFPIPSSKIKNVAKLKHTWKLCTKIKGWTRSVYAVGSEVLSVVNNKYLVRGIPFTTTRDYDEPSRIDFHFPRPLFSQYDIQEDGLIRALYTANDDHGVRNGNQRLVFCESLWEFIQPQLQSSKEDKYPTILYVTMLVTFYLFRTDEISFTNISPSN